MAQITKGEDRSFTVTLRSKRSDGSIGDPLNLTNKVVTVKLRDEAGTIQTIACSILGNALLGKITVPFTDTISSVLKPGDLKFDIVVTEGTDEQIYPQQSKINVVARQSA